jgi:hypothetical protein
MNSENTPFVYNMRRQAIAATTFTAKTIPLNPNDILVVDTVSASNETSNSKVVDVGFIRGSTVLFIRTLTLTTAGLYYFVHPNVYVPSGYQLYVRFVTPTEGDIYQVNFFGHYVKGRVERVSDG